MHLPHGSLGTGRSGGLSEAAAGREEGGRGEEMREEREKGNVREGGMLRVLRGGNGRRRE